MRITLVSESFEERKGGAERCATALATALEARGHDVQRLGRDPARGRITGALALARDAERARTASGRLVSAGASSSGRAAALAPPPAREGPEGVVVSLCKAPGDVLFPQEGVHLALVESALRRHSPIVRVAAAALKLLSPRQWAFLAVEGGGGRGVGRGKISGRLVVGRAEPSAPRLYIALSRRVRDDMARYWQAPGDAIEVAPNGVDCERFRPPTPEERAAARAVIGAPADAKDGVVIAFVSNHFALRGLDRLIRAVAIANGTHRLLVIGRGPTRRFAALARDLGVEAVFAGEQEDVRPLLRAADVFALPTFYDACSLSTLEALATGLPVVTTAANGAAELFSGREGQVLPDPSDVGALAAALARLRDPRRRAEAGAAARETALRNGAAEARARVASLIEGVLPCR